MRHEINVPHSCENSVATFAPNCLMPTVDLNVNFVSYPVKSYTVSMRVIKTPEEIPY